MDHAVALVFDSAAAVAVAIGGRRADLSKFAPVAGTDRGLGACLSLRSGTARSSITLRSPFRALCPASRSPLGRHSVRRWRWRAPSLWRNLFEPIFFFGYAVPKIALFPVFTYVFGFGSPSKVAFTFLECLYPIVVASYFGFRGVQNRLIWTAQNFGAGRPDILWRVIMPAALPGDLHRPARGAAALGHRRRDDRDDRRLRSGLGYYITIWSSRFEFDNVYAAMFVIGVCGFVLDQILVRLRDQFVHQEPKAAR